MTESFSFARRQQLRHVIRERRQPSGDFPLALLRLEQLVGDVERGEDGRLVRLDDRPLGQDLLQGLIDVRGHFPGVLRRQVGAHRVLLAADHHLDRVLLGAHSCTSGASGARRAAGPATVASGLAGLLLEECQARQQVVHASARGLHTLAQRLVLLLQIGDAVPHLGVGFRRPPGPRNPRYPSTTPPRARTGPAAGPSPADTAAALTPAGSSSATSRSTGGCVGSGRYRAASGTVTSNRTSNPKSGAAQTGASASRARASPTTSPPRSTATHPPTPSVAG